MQAVGAGLNNHLDRRAAVAAGIGAGVRGNRKLLDRFHRNQGAGDTGNTALIDRDGIRVGVVVIRAIDLVVRAVGAHAVY